MMFAYPDHPVLDRTRFMRIFQRVPHGRAHTSVAIGHSRGPQPNYPNGCRLEFYFIFIFILPTISDY